jgi:steroid 5-alpha reductase family enzyme
MSGFSVGGFGLVALTSALAIAALMVGTAYLGRRAGKVSIVDVTWGLTFVAVAWVGLALGPGDLGRRALVAALVTVWGGRLAWHIGRRAHGAPEDPRYVALLADAPGGDVHRYAVRKVFVPQGLIAWFVSLPIQVSACLGAGLGWVGWLGVAVWAVGFGFEAVGDAQLRRFKADPANRGRVMDRGLWAWTRHPNYFGDATMSWGLWVIAAEHLPGVFTVLSPVLMTWLLVRVSGAKLLEQTMGSRPGYAAYIARTSGFFPRPPRRP